MLRCWFHHFPSVVVRGGWLAALLPALAACAASGARVATPSAAEGSARREREPLPADIVARSALPLYGLAGDERLSEPELWDRMASFRAVCLGEQHDSPQHHYAQQRSIEELAQRSAAAQRPLAVGFEMFQTPYQPALTSFMAGAVEEAQFLLESEYEARWGFDFALYRPLLEAARTLSLEALALNAPRELTRQISRNGLASLDAPERARLPELELDDGDHRAYFDAAMAHHPMPADGPRMDDMYAVQVVWDETMADSTARWLSAKGPVSQAIVLAGAGHCHRSAVPARLARRIGAPVLSISAVLESKLGDLDTKGRYDWLLVLRDEGGDTD